MIVSASRRTDIPAFFMDWFALRLREGFALAQNPMNAHQVRRVNLSPDTTELVFWTKNAEPLLAYLPLLDPYPYYIQFTITPYGADIEPGLPPQTKRLETFRRLSDILGPERLIWRCDPLFWSSSITSDWLVQQFAVLARALRGCTHLCIISFVDLYRCMRRRFGEAGLRSGRVEQKRALVPTLRAAAAEAGMDLTACCEPEISDLADPASCIDAGLLARIAGREVPAVRDHNQRPLCGCAASIDIGVYDSCGHGCLYCYAKRSRKWGGSRPDVSNPLLLGKGNAK